MENKKLNSNLLLGATTAAAAAMVNAASVIIFFAYTSNITGHVVTLAVELAKGHWYQANIVFIWLLLFFGGSFVSQLLIRGLDKIGPFISHSAPIVLEIAALLVISTYGHLYYNETLQETEILIASLLFCMGLQNGMVATLSDNQVKTTHLTGLITDLGREVASSFFERDRTQGLMNKLKLHVTILVFYLIGGLVGGVLFLSLDFIVFYLVVALLAFVLYVHLESLREKNP
ncbi:MAG TPA: YoaK family protein [Cytophagaceae bacterium]|jgi:uncharacterized membrane protein YoaK (UPF0700 family)|nr:YoaK family protein [Cytophagaceae bacterium]